MDLYDGWPFPREEKWCYRCKQNKPFTEFGQNHAKRDGLQDHCNECKSILRRRWRAANLQKIRARDCEDYKKKCDALAPRYIRQVLRRRDILIAPDTMALKRAQLQLIRSLRCTTT